MKGHCEREITVIRRDALYPVKGEFGPSELYPEYPFAVDTLSAHKNDIYQMVRDGLIKMGLDSEHVGQPEWNPLGEIIAHGDYVLLKPNMVLHENRKKDNGTDCLITHPSVVRAVLDYVVIALGDTGRIVIGDAPLQSCDFEKLVHEQGYCSLVDFYKEQGVTIELTDFRLLKAQVKQGLTNVVERKNSSNCTVVDLGGLSEHKCKEYKRLRVTGYDPDVMQLHHNEIQHEYMIANQVLSANVIINLPKPKTHRKAGMTGALKNLIGINGNKDWLPHHKMGPATMGGDEYDKPNVFKRLEAEMADRINRRRISGVFRSQCQRFILRVFMQLGNWTAASQYHEGSWYGNDTIWRTIIDLNRILLYADMEGRMRDIQQRKIIIIGDMIVSGEGEGPLMPSPKHLGMLIFGWNAVAFDTVVTDIMGFDYRKIPSIAKSYGLRELPLVNFGAEEIIVIGDKCKEQNSEPFLPAAGWRNYIERDNC